MAGPKSSASIFDQGAPLVFLCTGVCMGIFQHDGVNRGEIEKIVDDFPGQSIDFFGAMRARVYDDKVC